MCISNGVIIFKRFFDRPIYEVSWVYLSRSDWPMPRNILRIEIRVGGTIRDTHPPISNFCRGKSFALEADLTIPRYKYEIYCVQTSRAKRTIF